MPNAVYDHETDAPRRRPVADWGVGEDVFDHMPRRRFTRDERPRRGGHERAMAAADERAGEATEDDTPRLVAPDGRRTVVISGRPGERAIERSPRRRPPKTAAERLGPRPDRIVAWIVAVGALLILIALLS
jgi:hypothetical protein